MCKNKFLLNKKKCHIRHPGKGTAIMKKLTIAQRLSTNVTTEDDQNVVFNYLLLAEKGKRDTTFFSIKVDMLSESGNVIKTATVPAVTDNFTTAQQVFEFVVGHKIGPYTIDDMIEEWLHGEAWDTLIPPGGNALMPVLT